MRDLPEDAFGAMLVESAELGAGYVTVPAEWRAYTKFPEWILDVGWCGMQKGTLGMVFTPNADTLVCTLDPDHDGGHGWKRIEDQATCARPDAGLLAMQWHWMLDNLAAA